MSLTQKGFSGFIYTFVSSVLSKVLLFGGGIYLARLLTPEDFGLVAMIYIIFAISNFLISGGFGLAIIREKTITEADKSTVFYFNVLTSVFLYILIWFGAPGIADFYQREELVFLTRLMGLDLLFNSLTIIQNSVLQRELKFKYLSIIQVVSGVITIIVAILLAHTGFGVIALAVKFILASFVSSIMLFIINPWIPKGFINKKSFKKLFAFSSHVMLLGLVNNITRNIHQVVIGKYFLAPSLGFFNQGNMLKDNVTNTLNDTVMKVSFPMLSQLQDDKARLKKSYLRLLEINTFTIFPIITILILTAEPLILGLLGEKWQGSIVFLQILGISGYVRHLHSINLNILKVYGKGRDYLAQGIIRNGVTIIGILIAVKYSVIAIAWALVVTEFLQLFVNVYYSNKYINFKFSEQFKLIFPIILITILMAISVYGLSLISFPNELLKLFVLGIGGLFIYVGLSFLFKIKALYEIVGLIKPRLNSLILKK